MDLKSFSSNRLLYNIEESPKRDSEKLSPAGASFQLVSSRTSSSGCSAGHPEAMINRICNPVQSTITAYTLFKKDRDPELSLVRHALR
jgi:hypothetical protein